MISRRILIAASLALLLPLTASAQAPAPEDAPTIAVLGSSVAAGWVTSREAKHDLENGWAARLGRLLGPRGWRVANVSVPGDSTRSVLARMARDLEPTDAAVVLIALSLGNEGLLEDREAAVASFRKGLLEIVDRCAAEGRIPMIGLCYPYDGYGAEDYAAIRETNLWIQELGLPCVGFLGALDDGRGHFVEGCAYDEGHPGNRGHEELFLTVVPSLFDAVFEGRPEPERPAQPSPTTVRATDGPTPLSHVPEDLIHSFTMSFRFRSDDAGALAAVRVGQGVATISLEPGGGLTYRTADGGTLERVAPLAGGEWHDVTLCHRHLLGFTMLYLDGKMVIGLQERLEPRQFVLGGSAEASSPSPERAEYQDWWIHRTALSLDEMSALRGGAVLPASLEVYAPLDGVALSADGEVENRAQSTARVVSRLTDVSADLARLEERIENAAVERDAEPAYPEPEIVQLETALLDEYAGEYELGPGDVITVKREGDRLLAVDRGMTMELHALSETTFFIRTVGEPRMAFERDAAGEVQRLVLEMGETRAAARRLH